MTNLPAEGPQQAALQLGQSHSNLLHRFRFLS